MWRGMQKSLQYLPTSHSPCSSQGWNQAWLEWSTNSAEAQYMKWSWRHCWSDLPGCRTPAQQSFPKIHSNPVRHSNKTDITATNNKTSQCYFYKTVFTFNYMYNNYLPCSCWLISCFAQFEGSVLSIKNCSRNTPRFLRELSISFD